MNGVQQTRGLRRWLPLILVAPVLSGCVTRLGDLTIMTTKNVGQRIDLTQAIARGEFEGTSIVPIILGIPIGSPNIEAAIDEALARGQGQVLSDAVVESQAFWLILFGEIGYRVRGQVWQIPALPLPEKPEVRPPDPGRQ